MKPKALIKSIVLTILILFIFNPSFCQENYLTGYIVQLSGDTLQGFVDYQNWGNPPDKITFKEKTGSKKEIYTPNNIKAFGVLDEKYESAFVETEISPGKTDDLTEDSEIRIRKVYAFLQTMISGTKSLYFYMNDWGNEQFYIKNDTTYELLVYKKYTKIQDGLRVIAENKKYINQLMVYLSDCKTIQTEIENLKYEKKSLENLFLFYYEHTHSEIIFQKKTEKTKVEVGIIAGLSHTTLKFSSIYFPYLTDAEYKPSINFSAGLFLDIILRRNLSKWSICNELTFASYKVSGSYKDYENENKYIIKDTKIGFLYLKLNNMLRYKYPIRNVFVYLNGGFSNGISISTTNYMKTETRFYSAINTEEETAIKDIRTYEQSFIVGLGIKYKKYSLEYRYERGNGMSVYKDLKSITNRSYFMIGYKF